MSFLPRLGAFVVGRTSRLLTRLATLGDGDPTEILLACRTEAQCRAEAAVSREAKPVKASGRVLVLVPFRDQWPMTEACLASLARQDSTGLTVEVLLIDNGSKEKQTSEGIAKATGAPLANGFTVRTLRVDESFNFSRLNNLGARAREDFRPDFLLCLNNDVETRAPSDLARLVAFAAGTKDAGAVGCTLVFPNDAVQHLFLAPGVKIVGAHPLKGFHLDDSAAWFASPRAVGAVTGACLLVEAKAFQAVGGFDEQLPTVGQDLDLCLKLQKSGRTNWVLPGVRMLHKEGASKGKAIAKHEVARMYAKWGEFLTKNPFYSDRLSRFSEAPAYRLLEPAYPWEKVL